VVFGNEKHGVSAAAAEAADERIVIPMLGMVPSLNVSVATAVVMFEAQRQRQATPAPTRAAPHRRRARRRARSPGCTRARRRGSRRPASRCPR
jgi:tRNA C32,U32 (ribose-2'-O)-methylase TrmJ